MVQIKKFENGVYDDKSIDSKVNEWISLNIGHIEVINIQYALIDPGYEVVIVIYNECGGLN